MQLMKILFFRENFQYFPEYRKNALKKHAIFFRNNWKKVERLLFRKGISNFKDKCHLE